MSIYNKILINLKSSLVGNNISLHVKLFVIKHLRTHLAQMFLLLIAKKSIEDYFDNNVNPAYLFLVIF